MDEKGRGGREKGGKGEGGKGRRGNIRVLASPFLPFSLSPFLFLSIDDCGKNIQRFPSHLRHDRLFHDGVGEQFHGNPLDLAAVPIGLDQVAAGGDNLQIGGQTKFGGRRGDGPAQQVGLAGGRIDVNFPKHRGSSSP